MCPALQYSLADDFVKNMLYGPDSVRDKPVKWCTPTIDITSEWSVQRKRIFPNAVREVYDETDLDWRYLNNEELQNGFNFFLHASPPDII